jgi:methylmalonyl-CoA mutase cobalamin-binding domain/chain
MGQKLSLGIVDLKKDEVIKETMKRAAAGEDPFKILEECKEGMEIVGKKFQEGEFFLAELMLSAEIFKEAFAVLQPHMSTSGGRKKSGKILLATLRGDIHDLGKSLFSAILDSQGFEVHDLGVDVRPEVVVQKVKEIKPEFVGFSALMTMSFEMMRKTEKMFREAGIRDNLKLMIGGGVTTAEVAKFVGADFQTVDAIQGLNYCKKIIAGGM